MPDKSGLAKWRRQKAQAERKIIAWDGEGINKWSQDGLTYQNYSMLSNSLGERMIAPPGENLERALVLQWMIDCQRRNPKAIHVVFGGNYDFNMIVRGNAAPYEEEMRELYENEELQCGPYKIKVMWGRVLEVRGEGQCFKLYDVMPFFQTSFIKACDSYLGTDWPGRDIIVKMKADRGTFTYEQMTEVNEYNDYELETLVLLVEELRSRLFAAGLRITQWYGPGAIAAYIYKQEHIKLYMDQRRTIDIPEFGYAVRSAYAGGRFEVIKTGYNVTGPVYEYDINSAYPYAMTKLPDLASGWWETINGEIEDIANFGLYHLTFTAEGGDITNGWNTPFPLFHRNRQSLIFYPPVVSGWFWSPEVKMAQEYVRRMGGSIIIDKAYVYHSDNTLPFSFVKKMYDDRQRLKAEGSGAQIGLKLGLNSLYGKMAQQVGYDPETDRLPPFHQLEWAGFVTSHCRAQIMMAVIDKLDSVIAFATDAVFLSEPIEVSTTSELGDWEEIRFDNMSMLQSGIYFGSVDGERKIATRGIRLEDFHPDEIIDGLRVGNAKIVSETTRFMGLGASLARIKPAWCCWMNETREIALLLTAPSKRMHGRVNYSEDPELKFMVCRHCYPDDTGYTENVWHDTFVMPLEHVENKEHQVEWAKSEEKEDWITQEREYEYFILEYE
jgi:DNA polymerase type B, organellar and viral